jgi:type I restriction enzyme S subunit
MFLQMKINLEESGTLEVMRDALLPKLLSGEVRVKQAEKIVESHA